MITYVDKRKIFKKNPPVFLRYRYYQNPLIDLRDINICIKQDFGNLRYKMHIIYIKSVKLF